MRLIGVATVRNEADIFEAFARSNLGFLDELHVVLHRCRDGTREIAAALRNEGLKLRLFEDEREGFVQEAVMNNLVRGAFADSGADFVFPIDADEILQAADRGAIEAALAALPPRMAGLMRWQTYVCTPGDDAAEACPTRRITHRYDLGAGWDAEAPARVDAEYCKVVVGRWFHQDKSAVIYVGNHAVFHDGKLAMVPCPAIEVAHFPVRSLDQLGQKAALGWLACVAAERDPEAIGIATHWQRLYEKLRDNGALAWEDAAEFVSVYVPPEHRASALVPDPVADRAGPMLHGALQRPRNLTSALLELAERLARERPRPI